MNQANQPYKLIHEVDMASTTSVNKPSEHDAALMIKDLKVDHKASDGKVNTQVMYQQKQSSNQRSSGSKENKHVANSSKRPNTLNNT